jgi:hypothetical protein
MILPTIQYTKGWKYCTDKDACFDLPYDLFGSLPTVGNEELFTQGGKTPFLYLYKGFLWDGPSGPAIDHRGAMAPSLFHDGMYYLCREGLLDYLVWRQAADVHFRKLLLLAGISEIEAMLWYEAVHYGAAGAAVPQTDTVITIEGIT